MWSDHDDMPEPQTHIIVVRTDEYGDIEVENGPVCDILCGNLTNEIARAPASMAAITTNKNFAEALEQNGFIDTKAREQMDKSLEMTPRYFLMHQKNQHRSIEIRPDTLNKFYGEDIASDDVHLVQVIDKESIKTINPELYEKYKESARRKALAKRKRQKDDAFRAGVKEKKRLEKAADMLRKAGIEVPEIKSKAAKKTTKKTTKKKSSSKKKTVRKRPR